jgi:NADH-quinone oxidoreductase subunit L
MMTAFYMFRAYYYTFTGSFRGTEAQKHHLHESPWAMTLPLIVLAILSVIGGWLGIPAIIGEHWHIPHLLNEYLSPVVNNFEMGEISHHTEWILMGTTTGLAIAMILLARSTTKNTNFAEPKGFAKVLANKWYIDELYDAIIIKPINKFSQFLYNTVELRGVDGAVNGVGQLVQWGSARLKNLQSGQVGNYLFAMVIGIIIIFAVGIYTLLFKIL